MNEDIYIFFDGDNITTHAADTRVTSLEELERAIVAVADEMLPDWTVIVSNGRGEVWAFNPDPRGSYLIVTLPQSLPDWQTWKMKRN